MNRLKNGLKIRNESLPERCEVCHQADLFEPESGICRRCKDLPAEKFSEPTLQLNLLQRTIGGINLWLNLLLIRFQLSSNNRSLGNLKLRFVLFTIALLVIGSFLIIENKTVKRESDTTSSSIVKIDHRPTVSPQTRRIEEEQEPAYSLPSTSYTPDKYDIFTEKEKPEKKSETTNEETEKDSMAQDSRGGQ